MTAAAADDDDDLDLPTKPIDRIIGPLERFLHVQAASGIALLLATIAALVLANSPAAPGFLEFWNTRISFEVGSFRMDYTLRHWINDGLMTIFFFVIGLEVKREIVLGELRSLRAATLPIAAALGGMVVPAALYLALIDAGPAADGWGIPMATDIAFVVGCLAVLGSRVPRSLRVLLVSLAIADDIGAVLVIAVGYTHGVAMLPLGLAAAGFTLIVLFNRLGIRAQIVYWGVGALIWLAFHESGVHATIAGVLLGLAAPTRRYVPKGTIGAAVDRLRDLTHGRDWDEVTQRGERVQRFRWVVRESVSPVEYLETVLHPWVAFGIMPLFALANAGIPLQLSDLGEPVAVAVAVGLVVGKPLGIVGASFLAVRLGLARLPDGVGWKAVVGGGMLAGIGFTMSLFITGLALEPPESEVAKIGVLAGSALAACLGLSVLGRLRRPAG